jgi:hypothetical protein
MVVWCGGERLRPTSLSSRTSRVRGPNGEQTRRSFLPVVSGQTQYYFGAGKTHGTTTTHQFFPRAHAVYECAHSLSSQVLHYSLSRERYFSLLLFMEDPTTRTATHR